MDHNDRNMEQKCNECGFEASGLDAYAEMRKHKDTHEWWKFRLTEQDKTFLRVQRIKWD